MSSCETLICGVRSTSGSTCFQTARALSFANVRLVSMSEADAFVIVHDIELDISRATSPARGEV